MMPPLSGYLKDYAGKFQLTSSVMHHHMMSAFSPEPFILAVQVPESFRGGCSFGAGNSGLSHQEVQGMPIIERQVQQP